MPSMSKYQRGGIVHVVFKYVPRSLLQNPEPIFVIVYGAQESIPPAYVVWRASKTNRVVVLKRHAKNRFLGSLKGLQIRALIIRGYFV